MRKVTAGLFSSVDGVVEDPFLWQFDSFDEELGAGMGEMMGRIDTGLLGRVGYQQWARVLAERGSGRRLRRVHQPAAQVCGVPDPDRRPRVAELAADRRPAGGLRRGAEDRATAATSASSAASRWSASCCSPGCWTA